jgi:hypothetical protein
MLPKTHLIFGAIFSVLVYFFFSITFFQASLIFLSSFLIDIDHYLLYICRKKDFSLKNAYLWHKNIEVPHKPFLHIFHTIELILLIGIFSFIFQSFLFVLIGILFHSIFDTVFIMYYCRNFYAREFFLTKYFLTKDKSQYM